VLLGQGYRTPRGGWGGGMIGEYGLLAVLAGVN
jgi:hypothetical protein